MAEEVVELPVDVVDANALVEHLVTEDDEPVDNLYSEKQQRLLTEPLYSSWSPPAGPGGTAVPRPFLAAANVGLFAAVSRPPLVPDMFLSLDVQVAENWYEKRHRSYFFWEFGKAPEVVVEVVSNTKGGEESGKLREDARMGILYYVIYDPVGHLSDEVLQVYELQVGQYQRRPDTRLPLVGLGLLLWAGSYEGKHDTWLRWCEAQGGLIATGAERAVQATERERQATERERQATERERQATERERQATERERQATERAERLAARLRALGVDPASL